MRRWARNANRLADLGLNLAVLALAALTGEFGTISHIANGTVLANHTVCAVFGVANDGRCRVAPGNVPEHFVGIFPGFAELARSRRDATVFSRVAVAAHNRASGAVVGAWVARRAELLTLLGLVVTRLALGAECRIDRVAEISSRAEGTPTVASSFVLVEVATRVTEQTNAVEFGLAGGGDGAAILA